jgi:phosphopantothenoylcysteine decarboxylase/phosphopantothenate--cysteine ligase
MTRAATRFVQPLTFEAITGRPVLTSQFAPGLNATIEHIALASSIDLLLVAPATANTLARLDGGLADDFLTTLYLASRAPVLVAPAMNANMWTHDAVQANLRTLAARGVRFVEPGDGYLACGWVGPGRLAEPDAIVTAADAILGRRTSLEGRRVLVTAGPTVEDIDPARFLGNRSTGRMGFAIAREAAARGAEVVLVAGPTTIEPPAVSTIVRVRSSREMHQAVLAEAEGADAVIMAAAVADYARAGGRSPDKIEKGGPLVLHLERTPDILSDLGRRRGEATVPILIGFAAETGDLEGKARRKLLAKRVDLIVANDIAEPGAGFEGETNRVTLVAADGSEALPLLAKTEVAARLVDRIETLLSAAPAPAASR